MSLPDNVHQLVNPHMTRRLGKTWIMPPLLTLLDRAITETRTGAEASNGTSIPVSAGALAIQCEISEEALTLDRARKGGLGTVEEIVGRWRALWPTDPELEEATGRWVKDITELVDPVRPQRRLTIPCVSCGVLYHKDGKAALQVHCYDDEGRMKHITTWTAECRACGAGWPPDKMPWLMRALTAKDPK